MATLAEKPRSEDQSYIKPTLQLNDRVAINAEAPEILPSDIVIGHQLAKGNFGTVYKGKCRGDIVAIKELNDLDEDAFAEFKTEVAIMSHLRHPNVVLLMGAVTRGDVLCIVTEFCPGGDLDHLLNDPSKELTLAKKIKIMQDVAQGMNWLHCSVPPIIHRDLKPGNILLNADYSQAKVADLGLSAIQHRRKIKSYGAGSYLWMAPESLLEEAHTEKVDVYSFGIVMWQVLEWNPDPFKKYLEMGDLQKLIEAICVRQERPEISSHVHPSLRAVIEVAWHQESRKRPSFGTVMALLDDALLKSVITDRDAADFWRQYYGRVETGSKMEPTKQIVPFATFAQHFFEKSGEKFPSKPAEDKRYLCLRALAAERHPGFEGLIVTFERFASLFKWFGPMCPSSGTFLQNLLTLVSHEWFHGDVTKDEAQTLLTLHSKQHKHPELSYLVRLSTSEPITKNPYTISKISKTGSIVHQRVYYDSETHEYYITVKDKSESTRIASTEGIAGLIKTITGTTKLLKSIVPRTKYHEIFHRHNDDMGYLDDES